MTDWFRAVRWEGEPAEPRADDDQLAKRALNDPEALAQLYRRHVDRVYRYLLYRVGNVHDAQDLTSETFTEVVRGLKRYRGNSGFAAWVIKIARYNANDHFRRQRPQVSLESVVTLDSESASPDERLEQQLTLERVFKALLQINPDRAEAVRLRMFGELSTAEVGALMGRNEAAVRMLIHRGIADLKQLLKEDSP